MKDILEVLKIMHSILDRLTLAVGKEHERIKDIEYRISVLELEKKSKQLGKTVDPGKSIAGKGLSYFPTGKKKGGKIKAKSKYSKGGGVRTAKYKI